MEYYVKLLFAYFLYLVRHIQKKEKGKMRNLLENILNMTVKFFVWLLS